jgi:hypothetical protein
VSSLIITKGTPSYRVTVAPNLVSSLLSSTLFSLTLDLFYSLIVRHEILLPAKLSVCCTLFCFVCQTGILKILDSAAANMTRIQSAVLIYFVVDFKAISLTQRNFWFIYVLLGLVTSRSFIFGI